MVNFNIDEKRLIVAILIAIMEADEIIDSHETDFLDHIISSFGMREDELDSIDELDINQMVSDFKTFESDKKRTAIDLFLKMAKCDGYADPRELEIIARLGS